MSTQTLFKISFVNRDKVYEIFARHIDQSEMYGFIEVEELIFGEKTSLVLDPSEERLKDEFQGVKRTFIPMHSIIRIDEVEKRGTAKIHSIDGKTGSASGFSAELFSANRKPENSN